MGRTPHLLAFLPFLIWIGFSVLLVGCSATYYSANSHNVPVFTEKNELQFMAGAGGLAETRTLNFQGAYSLTNHLAVQLNGARFINLRDTAFNHDDRYGLSGTLVEGALGFYTPFGQSGFATALYAGYGHFAGLAKNLSLGPAEFGYNRYYLQPEFGFSNSVFDLAVSLKTSVLNFKNVNYAFAGFNPENFGPSELRLEGAPITGENYFFMEPAITFRLGYRFLKFQGQLGSALLLNDQSLDYNFLLVSAGLVLHFKPSYVNKAPAWH